MSLMMIGLRRIGFLFPLLFLFCCGIGTQAAGTNSNPPASQSFLDNWTTAAKAVLPPKYQNRNLSFEMFTNLLSQEVEHGNIAAGGPLGCALIVQNQSQEEVASGLSLLRTSATNGDVPSMVTLGYLHENGKYVGKNYNEALHWFSLAAGKGSGEAADQVGNFYFSGKGVVQDYSAAVKWYIQAANRTNYEAMKTLGYLFLNGLGVDKDLAAAKDWSTQAANEGNNRRAMLNLGAICMLESSTNASAKAEAFRWYKQSADLGDPLACYEVATLYYSGWGEVKSNSDEYYNWLERAADLGSTEAQFRMGAAYRIGVGMPKDMEKAIDYYRKAADKNDPRALSDLEAYYFQDKTNADSQAMARNYMRIAAQAGNREAQFQLALRYFQGEGEPQDCARGKEWLAKAANNGWMRAEFLTYQFYWQGYSPVPGSPPYPKDKVEGLKWLRRAAEHGNLQAQTELGDFLAQGKDTELNKAEGEKWLREAASYGYPQAENDLSAAILQSGSPRVDFVEAAVWCKLAESSAGNDFNTSSLARGNFSIASARLTTNQLSEVDRRVAAFHPVPVTKPDPLVKDWEKNPNYRDED